jgi:general nucleoside transport system permease protein
MRVAFVRRDRASRAAMVLAPVIAFGLSILSSLVLFAVLGQTGGAGALFAAAGAVPELVFVHRSAAEDGPALLIAQGLAIGFRANVFNIGAEGQFIIGRDLRLGPAGLVSRWDIVSGCARDDRDGGAGRHGLGGIAAGLRTRFGANEILVTLMLA